MSAAKKGDKVKVHYTGKLQDGSVFDSSEGKSPLEFELGAGMMIAGFDKAVTGMKLGDKVTANIPSAEAYGPVRKEMIMDVPKTQLPEGMNPNVGDKLAIQQPQGAVPVTVTHVDDEKVTIDANHELAGKDLIFDIELVEIA